MTKKTSRPNQKLKALEQLSEFPLLTALLGRRSRRFSAGACIPSGPFAYSSNRKSFPLNELERTLIIAAMAGNTGWSHLIPFNEKYSPRLPNYAGSAGGRTFPSAAGFHTTELFFTDDTGVYFLSTRDASPVAGQEMSEEMNVEGWLGEMREKTRRLSSERLQIPNEEPHVESHNLWVTNTPGSLFAIPVADLAQHLILNFCYIVQNGYGVFDDLNKRQIPGLEKFEGFINLESPYPLSYLEQMTLAEATVELSTSCFSGALLLQAMGLGGWMYDGVDRHSVFGVSGDPRNKGLGFVSEKREDWNFPNPTGLPGVFEAMCPPHYRDMREAVKAVVKRKFGEGGPFNDATPGPWQDSMRVRKSAAPHSDEFIECVALMAQYVYDTFGKFPATLPSAYCMMYLQAFHLDTDFYDKFYRPGAYLHSHESHDQDWH